MIRKTGLVSVAAALCLLSSLVVAEDLAKEPPKNIPQMSSSSQKSATVTFGCSGVIIAVDGKHAYGLSAAHCCRVGKTFEFETADGGGGIARWVAEDSDLDLSLFKCWSKDVSKSVPVYREVGGDLAKNVRAIGYGVWGRKLLDYVGPETINDGLDRSLFTVEGGTFKNGDSGAGVMAFGGVVGIISHGEDNKHTYTSRHSQIVTFLDRHKEMSGKLFRKRGENLDAPPAPGQTIRSPVETGGHNHEGDSWRSLKTDRDRTVAIAKLQEEIAKLRKQIGASSPDVAAAVRKHVESIKSELRGLPGKDGKKGEDGKDGKSVTGKDGATGLPGQSGTVTIILIGIDGKEISRVEGVETGSVARVRLKRILESKE